MVKIFEQNPKSRLRGDTLIEVMFAVAVFGLGAVGAIALMNRGLASVQNSLETTMARQEIDAQAEALRFIHGAYLTEPDTRSTDASGNDVSTNNFRNLWKAIVSQAYPASTADTNGNYSGGVASEDPDFFSRTVNNGSDCNSLFTTTTSNGNFGIPSKSFIINPRGLNLLAEKDPATGNTKVLTSTDIRTNILITASAVGNKFTTAATYPRLLYGTSSDEEGSLSDAYIENNALKLKSAGARFSSAEGIWVTAVTSKSGLQCYDADGNPEDSVRPDFYDFHIQTCWDSLSGNASVISSTVRLFNPDQVSLKKQGMITFDNVEWERYDNNNSHQGPCSGSDPPEHIIASGTDIEFVGYTRDAMDEGVRYSIADRLFVTLDVDVDTSGILTHPGGEGLTITIGPIKANLRDDGGSITGNDTKDVTLKRFHLQMVRAGNHYTACADSICVEADSDAVDVSIDYNFKHSGHCCSAISKATLSNIEMTSNLEDEDAGGCIRVTPTADQKSIDIPGGDQPNNPPTEEEAEEESEEEQEEVEETIVAADGGSMQTFDVKFDTSSFGQIGIKRVNGIMAFPNVAQIASGITAEGSSCGIEFSNKYELHCNYPYATNASSYADGKFVIYLDRDSLTNDTSATYYGTGSTISDFWNQSDLKITIYFYDRIMYYNQTVGHEDSLARYKISSDNARITDSNGRYWIIARVYGNPSTTGYWANKLEIINQRTNRDPASFL